MRTREQSKAELQRIIKLQKKGGEVMAKRLEEQQTLIDQNAHDIKFLKGKLDEAQGHIDIVREQRDKCELEAKEFNTLLGSTREELRRSEQQNQWLCRKVCKAGDERDRARAALVEASINTSRLVEAVEPRQMDVNN